MNVTISNHAKERIKIYNLTESFILEAIREPDEVVEGYTGTSIAHKSLNEHLVRIVYAKGKDEIKVITVYPAKKERYRRKK